MLEHRGCKKNPAYKILNFANSPQHQVCPHIAHGLSELIFFTIFTSPRRIGKQAILWARILRSRRCLTHGGGQSPVKRAVFCRSPPRGAHLRKWSSSLHDTLITALILGRRSCTRSIEKEAPARGQRSK